MHFIPLRSVNSSCCTGGQLQPEGERAGPQSRGKTELEATTQTHPQKRWEWVEKGTPPPLHPRRTHPARYKGLVLQSPP